MNSNGRHPNAPDADEPPPYEAERPAQQRQEIQGPTSGLAEQTLAVDLARVEMDNLIATAHRFPRKLPVVVKKLEEIVLFNETSAENSIYILPRGGKSIVGPSIGFANALASVYGNCWDYGRFSHVDRQNKVVVSEGAFLDLEVNRRVTLTEQRRIVDSKGRIFTDDMIIITSKAAASIARRNAILSVIPAPIWRPIYDKALYIVRGSIETLAERRTTAFRELAKFGVDPKKVFLFLDVKSMEDVGVEHIPALRGIFQALSDGTYTVEELFDPRKMTSMAFHQEENPLGGDREEGTPGTGRPPASPAPKGATAAQQSPPVPRAAVAPEAAELPPQTRQEAEEPPFDPDAPGQGGDESNAQAPAARKARAKKAEAPADTPAEPARETMNSPPADTEAPWNRRTGDDYVEYAVAWMTQATGSASAVDDRYRRERDIRNQLGTGPLDEEQLAKVRAAKAEAEARLRGQA